MNDDDKQQLSFDLAETISIDTSYTNDTGSEYTFNLSDTTVGIDASTLSWDYGNKIDPDRVEKMCKEYPALEVTYRNFKAVYDLVKQDYAGKKEAGELDDDIVF